MDGKSFDGDAVLLSALRTGAIVGILSWIAGGGLLGSSCDTALGSGIAFSTLGPIAGALFATLAFTVHALIACRAFRSGWDERYQSVCGDDADVAGGSLFVSAVALLVVIGIISTAVFSIFKEAL